MSRDPEWPWDHELKIIETGEWGETKEIQIEDLYQRFKDRMLEEIGMEDWIK